MSSSKMFKRIYLIGFGAYLILFILSYIFFKERTIFLDIAGHLYTLLKDNTFVPNLRFGAMATQIYPLFAARAGLSLTAVMKMYSLGFICYHFVYYIICGALKRYEFAIVILLANLLFVTDTFFWIQSEFPQGISLFLLIIALISYAKPNNLNPILTACIFTGIFIVVFFHPLIIFPVAFVLLFFYFRKDQLIEKKWLYAAGFFFILIFAIKKTFFKNGYDDNAIQDAENRILQIHGFLKVIFNTHFLHNCIFKYYWFVILFSSSLVLYVRNKKWNLLFLMIGFCLIYITIINICFPSPTDFYIENLYLPLATFVIFPFVFDILPLINKGNFGVVVVVVICISSFIRISNAHKIYTDRLNWERNFMMANRGKKLIVNSGDVPMSLLFLTWATPYEFWLLSTSETGQTASIIINETPNNYSFALNYNNTFVTTWGAVSYNELPKKYFMFKDTTSPYIKFH